MSYLLPPGECLWRVVCLGDWVGGYCWQNVLSGLMQSLVCPRATDLVYIVQGTKQQAGALILTKWGHKEEPNSKQWPSSSQSEGTRRHQTASRGPHPHKVRAQGGTKPCRGPHPHKVRAQGGTKQQAGALILTKWGHKEAPNSKQWPSSSQSKGTRRHQTASSDPHTHKVRSTRRCQTASSGPHPHKVSAQGGTIQQAGAFILIKWGTQGGTKVGVWTRSLNWYDMSVD